jgi:hypothetical protein
MYCIGQVRSRVARGDVTEVEHGAEATAVDQKVGRVKVAVYPHWPLAPRRRRDGRLPDPPHGPLVDQAAQHAQVLRQRRVALGERDAAEGVGRGVGRGRSMQGPQKPAQADRGLTQVSGWSLGGDLPGQEGDDAPRPRVAETRLPGPYRRGNRQRQLWLEYGQPSLFVHDQRGGRRAPRQPGHELVADPAQDVIPAVGYDLDRQANKVRLLGA